MIQTGYDRTVQQFVAYQSLYFFLHSLTYISNGQKSYLYIKEQLFAKLFANSKKEQMLLVAYSRNTAIKSKNLKNIFSFYLGERQLAPNLCQNLTKRSNTFIDLCLCDHKRRHKPKHRVACKIHKITTLKHRIYDCSALLNPFFC